MRRIIPIFAAYHFESMPKSIYNHKHWPHFTWDDRRINAVFGEVKLLQGKMIGQMNALGFTTKAEAILTKVSSDTALRDIKDLIEKSILRETGEGGRSVNYELVDFVNI